MQKNYYHILEISVEASTKEIKSAYRRLAQKYHPDAQQDDASQLRFQEITEAYKILSSKESRDTYDQQFKKSPLDEKWRQAQETYQHVSSGNTDHLFRRRQMAPESTEGLASHRFSTSKTQAEVTAQLDAWKQWFKIKLDTLTNRSVKQKLRKPPPSSPITEKHESRDVRGFREYLFTINTLESLQDSYRELAFEGKDQPQVIRVKIPAGVIDGELLRIPHPDTTGSIPVRIRVSEHPLIDRDGSDIILKLPITISEAVYGAELEVPTLGGLTRIKLPPQTGESYQNKRFRLKGRGLSLNGTPPGDFYVMPQVIAPDTLSPGLEQALKSVDAHYLKDIRANVPKKL